MKPIPSRRSTIPRLRLLAALSALALTAPSHAETIWVDHNDQIANADAKWNVFAAPPASATAVVDANGNDDGVTVSYSGFSDSGNVGDHNGAFAGTAWDPGSGDYFFIGDGTTGTITVAGLLDSQTYIVRLVGSANDNATTRAGDFQVNGVLGDGSSPINGDDYDMFTDGFTNGEVMTWTGVAPSGGVITITMDDTSGATNGDGTAHLNAFSIEGSFTGGSPTIYEETFSGSGDLNGSAPGIRPGSETWSATASQWQADGTITGEDSDLSDYSAFLPFTPQTGKVYTLKATLTQPTGGTASATDWGAFGFADTGTILGPGSDSSNGSFWRNDTAPWMLYRESGAVVSFTGPGVTGSSTDATVSGTQTFSIVLDTTGSQWTVEWFDGTTSLNTHTYTSNPTINFVGFARENGVVVTLDDFSLTVSGGGSNPYDSWADGFLPTDVSDPTGNGDGDSLINLLEFGFGTDPTLSDAVPLNPDGSVNGVPIPVASGGGGGVTFDYLFVRRDDHGTSGSVTYTPQFSSDLTTFYDSSATPDLVADSTDDPAYEIVKVPYPAILPDGKKARFARMKVDEVP